MFVRASTDDQDATRAREALSAFHGARRPDRRHLRRERLRHTAGASRTASPAG